MGGKQSTVIAVRVLLAPIIRVLSSMGFSYRDFAETAKTVYVEVAIAEDRRRARKTSLSRVALISGITRREAARLRDVVAAEPAIYADVSTSISNLLHAWHTDPRYSDSGSPRELPLEGDASLEMMIQRHKGELNANALVRELVRLGVVDIRPGFARARVNRFDPRPLDELSLQHFACLIHDVGQTAGANVFGYGARRFERRIIAYRADPDAAAELKFYIGERVGRLFDELRDAMQPDDSPAENGRRVGFGAYGIDDD